MTDQPPSSGTLTDDPYERELFAIIDSLQAEVVALRAALRRLSFTRSDGSICYDGARCQRADVGSLCGGIWQHSQQCEEARRALADTDA